MGISKGYIIVGHWGNDRYFRDGIRTTKFVNDFLSSALKLCIDEGYNHAEIKYGTYEDTKYNMKEIGVPKMIGTFKKTKRNGAYSYSFTQGDMRFSVDRDGNLYKGRKISAKKKASPFGL